MSKLNTSLQLADKWNDIVWNAESGQGAVINVHRWFSKATLDAYVRDLEPGSNILLTDQKPASAQVLSAMTSALWKTPTTSSPSHIRT